MKGGFTPNHKLFQISRSLDSRLLMVESCQFWTLKPKLWASQIFTLIHLINNLVWAKSSKLMTFEENKISVQQLPYAFHCSLYSPLRRYKKVAVLKELCYKMQFVKNVLYTSSASSPLVFFFCYCFYEGFIPKIIPVSWFLLFICISYQLKVFGFDTGILRNSCSVLLLKTFSSLPQSVAFMPGFVSHVCLQYFPFRAFVTMICWTSTEVLLNLVAPLDSAVLSLDFEISIFWTSGFDSVSILFDSWIAFLIFDLGVLSSDLK